MSSPARFLGRRRRPYPMQPTAVETLISVIWASRHADDCPGAWMEVYDRMLGAGMCACAMGDVSAERQLAAATELAMMRAVLERELQLQGGASGGCHAH